MSEQTTWTNGNPAWIRRKYCPNSRDGAGHSQEWWDDEGECLWCGAGEQGDISSDSPTVP